MKMPKMPDPPKPPEPVRIPDPDDPDVLAARRRKVAELGAASSRNQDQLVDRGAASAPYARSSLG